MQHDPKTINARHDELSGQRDAVVKDIDAKIKALREELSHKLSEFNRANPFFPDGLVYSARARCRCGRGLCYREHDAADAWECAAVVLDGDNPHNHEAFPFAFYEIKSEIQPSAAGATTRPDPT